MLIGCYYHQIDEKGRIRIPPKLKTALGENFMVLRGTAGCLFMFSSDNWSKLMLEKIAAVPLSDLEAQRPVRMLFSSGSELESDDHGRYQLPKELREQANIKKDIVFIGVGNRAELWAREEYDAYLRGEKRDLPDFDKAIEALRQYGV